MRLHPHEFIRRFLMHVLPKGFHRIRHYGLFANANRAENIATARALLDVAPPAADPQEQPDIAPDAPRVLPCPCPRCGGSHDRDRGVRARLRAEVAPDAEQDRHIMSQTFLSVATCPFRCAGSTPAAIPLDPIASISAPMRPLMRSERLHEMPIARSRSHLLQIRRSILSASRPPSRPALPSNPHSARCTAAAQLPATSCLGASRTPAAQRVEGRHAGVRETCT